MKIIKTGEFEKAYNALPKEARRLFFVQEERFIANWRDSRLHVKKVRGLESVFSFRVTRRYRTLFYFHDLSTPIFFDIDHRKDAYRRGK